jgi:hypothetical protein
MNRVENLALQRVCARGQQRGNSYRSGEVRQRVLEHGRPPLVGVRHIELLGGGAAFDMDTRHKPSQQPADGAVEAVHTQGARDVQQR